MRPTPNAERRFRTASRLAVVAGAAGLLLLVPGPDGAGATTPEEEASAVVRSTVDEALRVLKNSATSDEDKRTRIEALAQDRFDFPTISRLVLGRNWRRMEEQQRLEFLEEFKRHLSVTYGENLRQYTDQEVLVRGSRAEKNGDVTVRTEVVGSSVEPVLVDYRMRGRESEWRVIDVIIEGISLIANFRTQTQEIISDVGPDRLIELLREKNLQRETGG